jgi:AAA domain
MTRWFNTAGPCEARKHYMLPPTTRLPNLLRLIEQESYFVIHAPRQTGKTTAMQALAKQLTESGRYAAVMVSAEVGNPFSNDLGAAELAILAAWRDKIADRLPKDLQPPTWVDGPPGQRIRANLRLWAQAIKLPLVLFIDEIDSLQDETLISVLRQLRDGYPERPNNFPLCVGLIGMRDVRDYKVASGGSGRLNTASPFNIKDRSLTMRNFNAAEVGQLYKQHTDDTGQVFTDKAVQTAFDLTQGQPWLVNALAKEIVQEMVLKLLVPKASPAHLSLLLSQDVHLFLVVQLQTAPLKP